jgi:hypothetical protein
MAGAASSRRRCLNAANESASAAVAAFFFVAVVVGVPDADALRERRNGIFKKIKTLKCPKIKKKTTFKCHKRAFIMAWELIKKFQKILYLSNKK